MSKEIIITQANFESEVLNSGKPVLIDFWAPWCGPCKMIAPVIEQIAGEYSEKLKVGKCDVDDNPDLAVKYGISSIPTLIVIKNREETARLTGASSKDRIVSLFMDKT